MNTEQPTETKTQDAAPTSGEDTPKYKWVSLESNPKVLNSFIYNLGVDKKWAFHDCLGLAPELLPFVPQPCLAVILLLPVSDLKKQAQEQTKSDTAVSVQDNKIYFMRQLVSNACGSIAVIHAVANQLDKVTLATDSVLANFLQATKDKSPEDRGKLLGLDEAISGAHKKVAAKGQTKPDDDHYRTDFHFIVFMNINGLMCELDGVKASPMVHGATCDETFLSDAATLIKAVMESNPGELFFSVLTFGPAVDDEAQDAEREEKRVSESDVATLVSMGWEETASREALRATGGVEAAIELLVSSLS